MYITCLKYSNKTRSQQPKDEMLVITRRCSGTNDADSSAPVSSRVLRVKAGGSLIEFIENNVNLFMFLCKCV